MEQTCENCRFFEPKHGRPSEPMPGQCNANETGPRYAVWAGAPVCSLFEKKDG